MSERLLFALNEAHLPKTLGRKAEGLLALQHSKVRIPKTWVVTFDGYRRALLNEPAVLEQLAAELHAALDSATAYAVRSSANIEDADERSFAGQFQTALNVRGVPALMEAIQSVWATARSEAVGQYLERMGHPKEALEMAVIVQEMVAPRVSGVAFSRNPVTGRDEVVIEAVPGEGTALVQDGVTPLHWVNQWGRWTTCAETDVAPLATIEAVVEQTRRLANKVAYDVDLEWAWDGEAITWLQMRRITNLKAARVYSNSIAREMLPGMIKPLVWSINVPVTNGAWVEVISEIIGKNDIDPLSLARQFHYRAYFDMGAFGSIFESLGMPPDSLERMAGVRVHGQGKPAGSAQPQPTAGPVAAPAKPRMMPGGKALRHLPRMLRFAVKLWTIDGPVARALAATEDAWGAIPVDPPTGAGPQALLERLDAIMEKHHAAVYYSVLVPFLLRGYEAMLHKGMKRAGLDFEQLDLVTGVEGLVAYQLPARMAALNAAFRGLSPEMQEYIRTLSYAEFASAPGLETLQTGLAQLLRDFGHLSDGVTDFSNITWREQPDLVLRLVVDYPEPAASAGEKSTFEALPLRGMRRARLRRLYERARRFRYFREALSSVYSRGLGLIRATCLALGDRFVAQGALEQRDDIFYLYLGEIREVVAGELAWDRVPKLVERRKAEMEASRNAELPSMIYGDEAPPLVHGTRQALHGMATSPGYHTGRVCVVHGVAEFRKLAAGDVLVVPFSDVAWTPLFARAGAVVAESGGMLSHSSIIAREYGIPAVVSVEHALTLPDGATVTVNGYTGEVLLHEEESAWLS